jgi:hypothetical protein
MAIQISGTTVIDNSRNITNGAVVCGTSAAGDWIATQAEAEAGTNNDQVMTPLRVAQAISALGGGMLDDDINWSACNAGCVVRGGGNVIYKQSNIIWIVAPSTAQVGCSTWPMGYCNGDSGATPNQAQRITGRSGWFIPDLGMLQTAYTCRSFWDTYSTTYYWSATERTSGSACNVCFNDGSANSYCKDNSANCVRPFRVVCY